MCSTFKLPQSEPPLVMERLHTAPYEILATSLVVDSSLVHLLQDLIKKDKVLKKDRELEKRLEDTNVHEG